MIDPALAAVNHHRDPSPLSNWKPELESTMLTRAGKLAGPSWTTCPTPFLIG